MATTLFPFKIPSKDVAYLRKACGKQDHEDLPKAVEDVYAAFARISNKIGVPMSLSDIKLVCYIAGVGMEPPLPKTMAELWGMGELKKGEIVECKIKRKISLNDEDTEKNPDLWVKARLQSYTPSRQTFVVATVIGNARHEIKHQDTRLIAEE